MPKGDSKGRKGKGPARRPTARHVLSEDLDQSDTDGSNPESEGKKGDSDSSEGTNNYDPGEAAEEEEEEEEPMDTVDPPPNLTDKKNSSTEVEGSDEDSDDSSDSDFQVSKKGKGKKRKAKTDSSEEQESTEEDSDAPTKKKWRGKRSAVSKRKEKGKKGKHSKRPRIKMASDSSDEKMNTKGEEEMKKEKKKKKKKKKGSSSEEDGSDEDEDGEGSPSKGRKKIRKIKSDKKLTDSARKAVKAEQERRKRITEKQKERKENILKHHTDMVSELSKMFSLKSKEWCAICSKVEMMQYLSTNDMGDVKDMFGLCMALKKEGTIDYGEYSKLREILVTCDVEAGKTIDKYTKMIRGERKGQPQAKRQRTDEGVGQQQSTEFSPKIAAMIERTKAMIEEDKKRTFIATKGFQDAKEKLHKNQVVVIKGNTGDGKTTTAIRLILGLIEEQQGRQPLQLHNIKDLDSLPPKSKLITFIDDIFGEIVAHEKDVGEWNKRIESVLPTLCGDKPTEANFLLITIRNVVFNSLRSHSLRNVFVDSNIIDLSSNDYKLKGEKLELLELYKPKKDEFSWNEDEKKEIVRYATDIGFPQCCRLFRDIPDLQKERVNFFKKPFDFLKRLLEKEENDLPVEILQMDQQSIQLYRKCLEEKEEEDYRLRVIVIGQTEVGKTTLTRNLLRLPQIIPHTESTDGVDIHNSLVNLDDKDWITDADMQHAGKCLDARLIQSLQSIGSENTGADPNTEGDKSAQTASNSDEFDNDDQQNAGHARPIQSLDSTASKNTVADHDDLQNLGPSTPANSNEPVLKTLRNLIKVPLADRDYTKLGELSVWDFAGQFVFYTTHHTFLTHRAVYLLVTRLDQNINDTVSNDQCFIDATGCKEMKIKARDGSRYRWYARLRQSPWD